MKIKTLKRYQEQAMLKALLDYTWQDATGW